MKKLVTGHYRMSDHRVDCMAICDIAISCIVDNLYIPIINLLYLLTRIHIPVLLASLWRLYNGFILLINSVPREQCKKVLLKIKFDLL